MEKAPQLLSPPQRLKGFFLRRESAEKVSAGVKVGSRRGASARSHAQYGRHPGEAFFQCL